MESTAVIFFQPTSFGRFDHRNPMFCDTWTRFSGWGFHRWPTFDLICASNYINEQSKTDNLTMAEVVESGFEMIREWFTKKICLCVFQWRTNCSWGTLNGSIKVKRHTVDATGVWARQFEYRWPQNQRSFCGKIFFPNGFLSWSHLNLKTWLLDLALATNWIGCKLELTPLSNCLISRPWTRKMRHLIRLSVDWTLETFSSLNAVTGLQFSGYNEASPANEFDLLST